MKKPSISDVGTVVLVICAIIITGLAVYRSRGITGSAEVISNMTTREVEGWEKLYKEGERIGSPTARVKIVEFGDYQCPFCAKIHATLGELLAANPTDISVSYLHLPLTGIHPHAYLAAVASTCASRSGNFKEFHDVLYRQQDSIGMKSWGLLAQDAGIQDTAALVKCLQRQTTRPLVLRHLALADDIGIASTPTFIINGRLFVRGLTPEMLEAEVGALLTNATLR